MAINRAKLAASGIYVPNAGRAAPTLPHHEIAREFLFHKRRQCPTGTLDDLAAELKEAGNPEHILMSSEFFQAQLHKRDYVQLLRDTLGGMGYRVQFIGYLRPQVSYIDSFYSQQSKNLLNTLDVNAFIALALRTKHYNFRRLLVARSCIGRSGVNYRPFNREAVQRGIVQDFLSALGLDRSVIETLEIPAAKNVRPGPKTVAACVEIARRLDGKPIALEFADRSLASRSILRLSDDLGWNKSGFSGITAAQAERIHRRFAKGDEIFSHAVWGRPWNEVFGEDCWTPAPLNIFDRASADAREADEFDKTVERIWRRLEDGKVEALAMDAGLAAGSDPLQRWLTRLRASSARLWS